MYTNCRLLFTLQFRWAHIILESAISQGQKIKDIFDVIQQKEKQFIEDESKPPTLVVFSVMKSTEENLKEVFPEFLILKMYRGKKLNMLSAFVSLFVLNS